MAVVGLVLRFGGLFSLHLAVLASGFALGWLFAESLDGSLAVVAVVALCGAAVAWVLAVLVFEAALLVVGGIAGGVIGAKLYGLLQPDGGNVLLAVLFLLAVAVLWGLATQHFQEGVQVWACAFGGAGLTRNGAARALPDALGYLRTPDSAVRTILAAAAWIALGVTGWSVQRRWAHQKDESRA